MAEEREMAGRIKRFRERTLPESFVGLIIQKEENMCTQSRQIHGHLPFNTSPAMQVQQACDF